MVSEWKAQIAMGLSGLVKGEAPGGSYEALSDGVLFIPRTPHEQSVQHIRRTGTVLVMEGGRVLKQHTYI